MLSADVESIGTFLNDTPISDDDKLKLIEEAKANFENIPGVEYPEETDNELNNIAQDFSTARSVIIKNINRLEKLTSLVFDNIATQPENLMSIQTGKDCIVAQNQNLKLLSELKNKALQNKQITKKLENENKQKSSGNRLPSGFTLK